ncbi:peptide ABC transporter permease [Clostridium thermosuccinogenes]|jgi:peptide/nickel transport system permease protein|uniref:Peptide ABC transporter permease n=1 Tax=Clostridium thermosuccinogenes TaxID=84032 RepID=A0A2K2FB27_9CLOT|nr:ABC transporter permease [Pseudoclostridium thermosuccinogenes]AUS97105.1 peptide ABC transporter permease [Pseudoclostridium thermosuccinogenes]PNT92223.1 peptide ABC transporter permease [Pseudoclostridium thermosuccinogenes]PNT95131.1 peptide ABC transporter permease [Pseudoclostridium thermosuccinogenes]PNT95967.1 peptide ABC transporter permease [Pseudoclostridium thermosuccinogenes]
MKKFWRNANFRLRSGIIITTIFFILGFVVYYIPHVNPFTYNSYPSKLSPSWEHWLGTTSMGQDIFWLLIEAIHNSLLIGLTVALIGTVVGVFVGLLAGFSGGVLDRVLTVVTDTFVVIPSLPILVLMTSLMKGSATVFLMALVLGMFAWAWPSRQIRSLALTIKERDFIHTAWFSGEGTIQVVVTEILPYALTWSLSNFMNATLAAIASESSLAVLGLSPANMISLGNMIQWARERNAIFARQWFWIGSPIVATVLLFIGLFLLITGYNDYLSMKRGK